MIAAKAKLAKKYRLSRRVGILLALLVVSATIATAAVQFYNGQPWFTITYHTVCCDANNNLIFVQEVGTSSVVGYLGDQGPAQLPKVGQVYYASFVVTRTATTNGAAHMEILPPPHTFFAIDATNPVRCYASGVQFTTNCPQTPTPLFGNYGYSFNSPPSGSWPNNSGTTMEIQVPMVSTKVLNGASDNSYLKGFVYASDGIFNDWGSPFAPVIVYANPPTITYPTPSATSITSTSAHLSANLLNHYTTGTAFFDFGTTTAYGTTRNEGSVTTGDVNTVFDDFTSLAPNTTYHWRLRFVTTAGATINGADQVFTTAAGSASFFNLTVSKAGFGSGTVTSSSGAINCGATCAASLASGTVVTLTATAAPGSIFSGWNGEGCSGTGSCMVTMNAAKTVFASFTRQIGSLSVELGGLPAGTSVLLGITGPDGFNTTRNTTTGTGFNFSDVGTGTYMVTAPLTTVGGATYSAPPQSAVVNFGTTTTIIVTYVLQATAIAGDYDGDIKGDMTLYKLNGDWAILKSSTGFTGSSVVSWGGAGYTAVPGDYDRDGKQDLGLYRQATGDWLVLKSSTNYTTSLSVNWGGAGYTAVPGDYDGDGKTDPAVYHAATGLWSVLKSSSNYTTTLGVSWGGAGYTPVPGQDFDGDGKADLTIYRRSTGAWSVLKSTTNYTTTISVNWGGAGYSLVPGDYDGDGKADFGLYQRATGAWAILKSTSGYMTPLNVNWGGVGYAPVPGDYDGDGKTDLGIFQQSTGNWSVLLAISSYTTSLTVNGWGSSTDRPVTNAISIAGDDVTRRTDFDGDARAELTVYNTASGMWSSLKSSTNFTTATNIGWGGAGYTPVPGDYDGDGKGDLGIYQQTTGNWYILLSSSGFTTSISKSVGGTGWTPVAADYDGDGKTDFAVYNTSSGLWYGLKSSTNYTTTLAVSWGGAGYTAAPGDFDGDGRTDLAIYQGTTGNWYVLLAAANYTTGLSKSVGGSGYAPVAGDFDGDGKTDFVVYNTSSGLWYGLKSSTNYTTTLAIGWGGVGYTPVQGDYDGDGKSDLAIYQSTSGNWYVLLSASGYTTSLSKGWGGSGYVPVPSFQ
jgi:hypothetical protein